MSEFVSTKSASDRRPVTVVGAGIIGIVCALTLQRAGFVVTVVDRNDPGSGCSFGNAGILTRTECLPYALPGALRSLPRWLLDPMGPLSISPWHLPRMYRWGLRFLQAANEQCVEKTSLAMRGFYSSSVELYTELLGTIGSRHLLRETGYLAAYSSPKAAETDRFAWDLHRKRGIELQEVGSPEIRNLVPSLSPSIQYGIFVPTEGFITDPHGLVGSVAKQFMKEGGRIIRDEVIGFDRDGDCVTHLRLRASRIAPGELVIAAGAWSASLADQLGTRVLLESMRGYHVTLQEPGVSLPFPVFFGEQKFFATPMQAGLRLAGTAEFSGLHRCPNFERADRLLRLAKTMLSGLSDRKASKWMGQRPMTPDSLPIIGRSPILKNVLFAFGHGHNGLSGAPMTASLIASLMQGRTPAIEMSSVSVTRFDRRRVS